MRRNWVEWTCDQCGKQTQMEEIAKLWYSVVHFNLAKSFCSIQCVRDWAADE